MPPATAGTIEERGLTQARAAERLRVTQADVSDLVRGKLKGFSTDRLIRFLNALGRDVEIVVHRRPRDTKRVGRTRVSEGSTLRSKVSPVTRSRAG